MNVEEGNILKDKEKNTSKKNKNKMEEKRKIKKSDVNKQ